MNWSEEWRKLVQESSHRKGGDPFTSEEFIRWYDFQLEHNDYPGILLDKVSQHLNKNSTLLDIGAGTGAFVIPLAQEVKEVTAIEPSVKMIARLRSKVKVDNIRIINQRWEDVNIAEIGPHDVVLAAYSLYNILDIETAIKKMLAVARQYLYIIMGAGKSKFFSDIWRHFKDEEYHPSPSYVYLCNILHELGVAANVEIIKTNRDQVYRSMEQAVNRWRLRLDLPQGKERELRLYLGNYLQEKDGLFYLSEVGENAVISVAGQTGDYGC